MTVLTATDLDRCRKIRDGAVGPVMQISEEVAAATGVPIRSILGRDRDAKTAEARQLVMFLARRAGLSFPAIGYAMNRDHTTIKHGVEAEQRRRLKCETPTD